ncbi:hypothetical protein [Streptomyces xinghaiensis]|uniref:hypothetical protein n=1 Tax=Streptomyces xinghaiensis TaxID=1038928 RepID=UPI002E111353|nr:hypothetical protein OG463_25325 [Streptomyces xinghaiensis]
MVPLKGRRRYARPVDGADRITARVETEELLIEAVKVVRSTDTYLEGHFPKITLYPAIFLLDGIRQAVGSELSRSPALATHLGLGGSEEETWLELGTLDSARVLRPMLDGDELRLLIRVSAGRPGALRAALDCRRADDAQVAKMTVELVQGGTS